MNEKQIKKVYTEYSESSAPNMDVLWEKIDKGLEEKSENRITSTRHTDIRHRKVATKKQLGVAAACISLIIAIPAFLSVLSSTKSNEMMAEMSENDNIQLNDSENIVNAPIESATTNVEPSATINEPVYYEQLKLAETQGFVNMIKAEPKGDEYFVLENVLAQTEVFADVIVEKVYLSEGGNEFVYELKKSDNDMLENSPKNIIIESATNYIMLENREYLLPLKINSDGGYELVFDNAPQIEITLDGGMIFHNGWGILDDGNSVDVIYPKNKADDFFYDRMRFSYKNDLSPLLEKWNEIRNAE